MLTKGAIGNLINRYRAVLKKCNLINTFGSLAVASMLVMGGSGVAGAATITTPISSSTHTDGDTISDDVNISTTSSHAITANDASFHLTGKNITLNSTNYRGINISLNAASDTSRTVNLGERSNSIVNISTSGDSIIGVFLNASGNSTANGSAYANIKGTSVTINSANGIWTQAQKWGGDDINQNKTAKLTIDADHIEITSTSAAITAMSRSEVYLTGAKSISINAPTAIQARDYSKVSISGSGITTIDGDISYSMGSYDQSYADASIDISLTGADSYWAGDVKVSSGIDRDDTINNFADKMKINGFSLTLNNDAKWIPQSDVDALDVENGINQGDTKIIAAPNVTLNNGAIVIKSGVDAQVKMLSGDGKVLVSTEDNNLGSFTATSTSDANLDVQAADADGNALNADQTDVETLKKAKAQVQAEGATVTASAAEGDVMGAISIAKDGTPTIARNTLMDDVLTMASVNSVSLDRILTNDVRKRLGDIRSDKNQTGVWMRWDGGKLKGDGLTNNFNTIQIGGDTKVGTNCRLGVAGSFTHGDTDFARGNGELEGFSFALYSTWMGENGMFADIVTRLGHFSNEMNVEGRKGDMDNRVFSLSGEYGWRFDLCKQFFLEPQVELAYTYVSSDDLQLGTAHYAFDNVNSLVGRAGLVAGWNLPDDMGNVYARASVLQQFMGDAKISGSNGNAFNVQEIDGNDTWMEYGIGANVKLTEKTYIWADVERTAGADLDEEWRGTVGLRYSF